MNAALVLAPDNEKRFLEILKQHPKDRHLDDELCAKVLGYSHEATQYALLHLLDAGVLRMNGFRYFIR